MGCADPPTPSPHIFRYITLHFYIPRCAPGIRSFGVIVHESMTSMCGLGRFEFRFEGRAANSPVSNRNGRLQVIRNRPSFAREPPPPPPLRYPLGRAPPLEETNTSAGSETWWPKASVLLCVSEVLHWVLPDVNEMRSLWRGHLQCRSQPDGCPSHTELHARAPALIGPQNRVPGCAYEPYVSPSVAGGLEQAVGC